jgi:predicted ester cyclase
VTTGARAETGAPLGVRPHGFDGVVDYIERITYDIWNGADRDPGLCHSYYGPETPIFMDGGDVVGAARVVANTEARLLAFPDFHGVIDDTVWTGDEATGYRTSMRWTWSGTGSGPSIFGPATGRPVRFAAIANCVVRGKLIVEEWLGVNPLSLARQLGVDPATALERWTAVNPVPGADAPPRLPAVPSGPDADGAIAAVVALLDAVVTSRDLGAVARAYSPDAVLLHGIDRPHAGAESVRAYYAGLLDLLPDATWRLDDAYAAPQDSLPARAAVQWTLTGTCDGSPVRLSMFSHSHVVDGRIVAEWVEYDELALLRQCGRTTQEG